MRVEFEVVAPTMFLVNYCLEKINHKKESPQWNYIMLTRRRKQK